MTCCCKPSGTSWRLVSLVTVVSLVAPLSPVKWVVLVTAVMPAVQLASLLPTAMRGIPTVVTLVALVALRMSHVPSARAWKQQTLHLQMAASCVLQLLLLLVDPTARPVPLHKVPLCSTRVGLLLLLPLLLLSPWQPSRAQMPCGFCVAT